MGTNRTKSLQTEIKEYLVKLNWSQKRFAREWYAEHFDINHDDEIKNFEEKVKKDLSRATVKPELLLAYRDFITQSDQFKKLDLVYHPYISNSTLSQGIESGMAAISQNIEKLLLDDDD